MKNPAVSAGFFVGKEIYIIGGVSHRPPIKSEEQSGTYILHREAAVRVPEGGVPRACEEHGAAVYVVCERQLVEVGVV